MKKVLFAVVVGLLLAEEGAFGIMYGSYFPRISTNNPDGVSVSRFTWDGDSGNTDIVIPDEYGSQKITRLGGYFGKGLPCPFFIDDTSWMGLHDDNEDTHSLGCLNVPVDMFDDYSDEWTELVYHDFDLYIGEGINAIFADPCATVFTVNGVKTAYCPRVCVHCDDNNATFYSKDGRLFYREDDRLVEDFIYIDTAY